MSVKVKSLIDQFPKAIILDFKTKEVMIIRNKKLKVYNKFWFDKFSQKLEIVSLEEICEVENVSNNR